MAIDGARITGLADQQKNRTLEEATALLRQGSFAAAAAALETYLAEHGQDAVAWSNLGAACMRLRRTEAACTAFEKAVALVPGNSMARAQLADARKIAGDYAAAIEQFQAARRLAPGDPRMSLGQADAHRMAGEIDAAVEILEEMIREQGDSARLQELLGDLKIAGGDFAAAEACYRAALRHGPGAVHALTGLSRLQEAQGQNELRRDIEARLAGEGLDDEARISLLFALGNLLDRAGEFQAAFAAFERGNRHKQARTPYDPAAQNEHHAELKRAFTAELLSAARDGGEPGGKAIFILGMPRSGTTLVERILGAHAEVRAGGELPYMMRLIQDWPELTGREARYPEGLEALDPAGFAVLGRRYLEKAEALFPGAPRITDKNPFNFENLGLIALILPGARIVHCRRDALDICASNYTALYQGNQAAFSYGLEGLAHYYRCYEDLMAHWRSVLPAPLLEVSYETLVQDTEIEARRLLEFCGLPWDARCLAVEDSGAPVLTASDVQVRGPITNASIGKWRRFEAELEPLRQALAHKEES